MRNQRLPQKKRQNQVVVSNIFYVHPYLRKISHFDEHIFQRGWFNHQLENLPLFLDPKSRAWEVLVRPHFWAHSPTVPFKQQIETNKCPKGRLKSLEASKMALYQKKTSFWISLRQSLKFFFPPSP